MSKKDEETLPDVEINNSDIKFDNLIIMKAFGNIMNQVRNEDFLEIFPIAKVRRVQWIPLFNCLKQYIFDAISQELTSMWEDENMPEKLEQLEIQKEKFEEINEDQCLWRPQLGDVKSQLRATDIANLQKQKKLLEPLVLEYEGRINQEKKTLTAKRSYLKALLIDIQKYQKKNEEFIPKMDAIYENHCNIIKMLLPKNMDHEELCWTENDLDVN